MFKKIDNNISYLNKSKVFLALMIVFLNLSSKYVTIEINDALQCYFKTAFMRQVMLFAILWIGTRDIYIAFAGSILLFIFLDVVFLRKQREEDFGRQEEGRSESSQEEESAGGP